MTFLINPYRFKPVDPFFPSVSLLLHGDGTNGSTTITDSSQSPKTVTAFGNAQISTAQSKFGGASIAFDGTGDYLTVPSNAGWGFDTGDFTVESWVYRTTPVPSFASVISVGYAQGGFGLLFGGSSFVYVSRPGTDVDYAFSVSVPLNAWFHLAVTRSQGLMYCFVDGTQIGSAQANTRNYAQQQLVIGADGNTIAQQMRGNFDDLRITKGVARYISNFTPPSASFPDS